MHKYSQRTKDQVRLLRVDGLSLDQIHTKTNIPRTTIRDWIFDIRLSFAQKEELKKRVFKALQSGRIKAEKIKRKQRVEKERKLINIGKKDIGQLTQRDLFIAGVALYWAEGFKNQHEHRLGFCNSDPDMVKFYVYWLKKALGINISEITARLALNVSYKEKEGEIKKYWSRIIGIPESQFTKTFYQHTKWKKNYNNDSYYGVLRIHVKESLNHLLKMKGWIQGLKSPIIS